MTLLAHALVGGAVRTGLVLPESVLHSDAVKVLATFVALNTLMYVTLAVVKILPRVHRPAWMSGSNRRAQDRSIYAGVPIPGLDLGTAAEAITDPGAEPGDGPHDS
ncbi:hypothetical protein OEB99_05065 [Actinotalea sp. M2MS4P-6]|uniref:hypothetical protein n=1 Tax=Actinotalea sp. M2MS4P-6 TaxID=2983762 RepID=UPI0021E3DEEF|nr:hypothetical protein [Actinotalea sp. M2MS4P-6]MCV2393672.1 hypothetical protein [Actinotalea sp. M2MS4P-6]